MFLFPWLHYGESMVDFEKSTFFHRQVIFHSVREPPRAIFCNFNVYSMGSKKFFKYQKIKKILKFCQKVSKVSGDSFMALYDPIVPEKSNF